MLINKKQLINLQLIALLLVACNSDYIPKPRGYFRIDLPEKSYQPWQNDCPFTFEYSKMALVTADTERLSEPCWLNIDYPKHKATIHLSYKPVENNIEQFLEDARTLVYKHTVKASDINETLVRRDSAKVYGLIYDLEGGTASPYQFYLTDSTNHFVRGALYFNVRTNTDSLAPVAAYIKKDIRHFIDTFEWIGQAKSSVHQKN